MLVRVNTKMGHIPFGEDVEGQKESPELKSPRWAISGEEGHHWGAVSSVCCCRGQIRSVHDEGTGGVSGHLKSWSRMGTGGRVTVQVVEAGSTRRGSRTLTPEKSFARGAASCGGAERAGGGGLGQRCRGQDGGSGGKGEGGGIQGVTPAVVEWRERRGDGTRKCWAEEAKREGGRRPAKGGL